MLFIVDKSHDWRERKGKNGLKFQESIFLNNERLKVNYLVYGLHFIAEYDF
jgi:hypothetical protein